MYIYIYISYHINILHMFIYQIEASSTLNTLNPQRTDPSETEAQDIASHSQPARAGEVLVSSNFFRLF